jgi:MFS transporter, PHS family, inorganic phosphate transporter
LVGNIQLIGIAGPNATTFITPAEVYPTRIRATAHGLSAAAGKIGAIVAQVVFAPMEKRGATDNNPNPWLDSVMQIFALFMFCGILTSCFVPESRRRRLEDLSGERNGEEVYELAFREGFWRRGSNVRSLRIGWPTSWKRLVDKYFKLT